MQETQVPRVGKIPWRKKWQSTPVFLPGKTHGQRSCMGYSPWGCKESVRHDLATKPQPPCSACSSFPSLYPLGKFVLFFVCNNFQKKKKHNNNTPPPPPLHIQNNGKTATRNEESESYILWSCYYWGYHVFFFFFFFSCSSFVWNSHPNTDFRYLILMVDVYLIPNFLYAHCLWITSLYPISTMHLDVENKNLLLMRLAPHSGGWKSSSWGIR